MSLTFSGFFPPRHLKNGLEKETWKRIKCSQILALPCCIAISRSCRRTFLGIQGRAEEKCTRVPSGNGELAGGSPQKKWPGAILHYLSNETDLISSNVSIVLGCG